MPFYTSLAAHALPLLESAGGRVAKPLLRAAGGVGIGYVGDHAVGDDNYTWQDIAMDGVLGSFGLGKGGFGGLRGTIPVRAGSRLLRNVGLAGAFLDPGGLSQLTGGSSAQAATPGGPHPAPKGTLYGPPVPRSMLIDGGSAFGGGPILPSVHSVAVNYTPNAAPTFNKTLKDFLADKGLQALVNQNIMATNVPLVQANKQEKIKGDRAAAQNQYVGKGLEAAASQRVVDEQQANKGLEDRAAARRALLDAQTQQAASEVPITYMSGEAAGASQEAKTQQANESAMSDSLIDRLASAGESYLKDLRGAQVAQTQVDDKLIHNKTDDAIHANVAQIRANQAQRGTLLGTLAAEQYKNAADLHNTNVAAYNDSENRRYQQASDAAKTAMDAQIANANNAAGIIQTGMQAEAATGGAPKPSANHQAAQKNYDKMNQQLSAMKGKPSKQNPNKLYIEVEGKKAYKSLQHERDRIKKKYGL